MTKEFVKCPCCEIMVPADNIELSLIRPDDIAIMDEDEIEKTCRYNDEIYIYEEEYFYIRGILPLPIHDMDRDYNLGVWVQVSKNSFDRIYDLWSNENQSLEAPFEALLANNVPLTQGSKDANVQIKLMGPKTRPFVIVKDENCSLLDEQTLGIALHRASEYSDTCR